MVLSLFFAAILILAGIEYLYENHLLKTDEQDVAQFLYKGEGLNKTAIGKHKFSIWFGRYINLCVVFRRLSGREEAIQRESAESLCRASRLHKSHPGASFKVNKLFSRASHPFTQNRMKLLNFCKQIFMSDKVLCQTMQNFNDDIRCQF